MRVFGADNGVRAGMRMSTRQADSAEDDCDPVRAVESAAETERHSGMKKKAGIFVLLALIFLSVCTLPAEDC